MTYFFTEVCTSGKKHEHLHKGGFGCADFKNCGTTTAFQRFPPKIENSKWSPPKHVFAHISAQGTPIIMILVSNKTVTGGRSEKFVILPWPTYSLFFLAYPSWVRNRIICCNHHVQGVGPYISTYLHIHNAINMLANKVGLQKKTLPTGICQHEQYLPLYIMKQ